MTVNSGQIPDESTVTQQQAATLGAFVKANQAQDAGSAALSSVAQSLQQTLESVATGAADGVSQATGAALETSLTPTQLQAISNSATALDGLLAPLTGSSATSSEETQQALQSLFSHLTPDQQKEVSQVFSTLDSELDAHLGIEPSATGTSSSATAAQKAASSELASHRGVGFVEMMECNAQLTSAVNRLQSDLASYGQQAITLDQGVASVMLQEATGASTTASNQAQQVQQQVAQQQRFHLFGHIIKLIVHIVVAVVHVVMFVVSGGASAALEMAKRVVKCVVHKLKDAAKVVGKAVSGAIEMGGGKLDPTAVAVTRESVQHLSTLPALLPAMADALDEGEGSTAVEGAEKAAKKGVAQGADSLTSVDFDLSGGEADMRAGDEAISAQGEKKAEEKAKTGLAKAKETIKEALETLSSGRAKGEEGGPRSTSFVLNKLFEKLPISSEARDRAVRVTNVLLLVPSILTIGGPPQLYMRLTGMVPHKHYLLALTAAQATNGLTTTAVGTACAVIGGQEGATQASLGESQASAQLFNRLSGQASSNWNSAISTMGSSESALSQTTASMLNAINQTQQQMAQVA